MADDDLVARAHAALAQDAAIPPRHRQQTSAGDPHEGMATAIGGGHSVNWRTMQDVQSRDEWNALRGWVEWMTVRYDIPVSMVPACWWQHPALVEELSALHCAHRAAFDSSDTGNGPLSWHERFAIAQSRLRLAYGGGCSSGHTGLRPRSWSGATDEDDWTAWINQSHAH